VGNGEVRMRMQGGTEYARMYSLPALKDSGRSRIHSLASDSLREDMSAEELSSGRGVSRGRKSLGSEGAMGYAQVDRRSKQVCGQIKRVQSGWLCGSGVLPVFHPSSYDIGNMAFTKTITDF
jgi:hypothetical protein